MHGSQTTFTPDDIYAHFRSFEEKIQQESKLALMANVNLIIATKSITDEETIKMLRHIALSKDKKRNKIINMKQQPTMR